MLKLSKYKYLLAIDDIIILLLSFFVSTYFFHQKYDYEYDYVPLLISVLLYLTFLAFIFIFIFDLNGLYKINIILSRAAHFTGLIKSYFIGTLIITAAVFFSKPSGILDSRLFVLTFVGSSLLLFYIFRIEVSRFLMKKMNGKKLKSNVLIVGDGKAGKLLATRIMYENPLGINIVGFIDEKKNVGEEVVKGKKIVGNFNNLRTVINTLKVDEILISLDIGYEKLLDTLDKCKEFEINIRLSSELFDVVSRNLDTEKFAGVPVINIAYGNNSFVSRILKRIFDLSAALIGLIFLMPLFVIIAIIIKLTSHGPVFFIQTRIGKDGNPFKFYKFRSMYKLDGEDVERKNMMLDFMKSDNINTTDTKVINDSRVTWIGRILRKTSLDELPQLFNVIKGDMSLVGPRPCLPYEYDNYDEWQKRRVNVLPGCTGVWQISGRSSVSFIDSIVLDLFYINSMSPWFDLQIILKTIPVMLLGRGGK